MKATHVPIACCDVHDACIRWIDGNVAHSQYGQVIRARGPRTASVDCFPQSARGRSDPKRVGIRWMEGHAIDATKSS